MLKKMSLTAAFVGALSLAVVPLMTSAANAQGNSTEPPKAPNPSDSGGAMKKGGAMKGGMMKKSKGGTMMKKGHGKKM